MVIDSMGVDKEQAMLNPWVCVLVGSQRSLREEGDRANEHITIETNIVC